MTKRRRWAGRRKWARLVRILTDLAETSSNERVKLAAAERLTEVMIVREQRELAEIRRAEKTDKQTQEPSTETEPEQRNAETAEEAADRFLAGIRAKRELEVDAI